MVDPQTSPRRRLPDLLTTALQKINAATSSRTSKGSRGRAGRFLDLRYPKAKFKKPSVADNRLPPLKEI